MSDECDHWKAKLIDATAALDEAQRSYYHYQGIFDSAHKEYETAVYAIDTCKNNIDSQQNEVYRAQDAVYRASNPIEVAAAEAVVLVEKGKLALAEHALSAAESTMQDKMRVSVESRADMNGAEARRNSASRHKDECEAQVKEHCN